MKKIFGKSRGQIAVLYAGIIATLVGAIALGADVGVMYMNWQQSQKVADAAALAGANYLGGGITYADPTTGQPYAPSRGCNGETSGSTPAAVASQVACTYAVNNKLDPSTITISETASTVTVQAKQIGLPYFFGKVLGLSTYDVAASATANSPGPVNGCDNCGSALLPIGLQCAAPCTDASSLVAGEPVSFGTKFISATINSPGNWDWVDLSGNGSSNLGNEIAHGTSGKFVVGQTIAPTSGNRANAGPVKKAFDNRMKSCPSIPDPCSGGNTSNIPPGDPCLVIVPAVDFTGCSGHSCSPAMTIEAFAEVYLEPTSTSAAINGCFITSVVGNTQTGSTGSFGPTTPPVLIN